MSIQERWRIAYHEAGGPRIFPGRYLALNKLDDTRLIGTQDPGFSREGTPHEREEERKKASGLRFDVGESLDCRTISFLRHLAARLMLLRGTSAEGILASSCAHLRS
jgi:hypothetical protein